MRIRTVKPLVWQHDKIVTVSREARLLFLVLITLADDEGRFLTSPAVIEGHGYPEDDDARRRIPKWLDELESAGLVQTYGGRYGCLPNWSEHQRISHLTPSTLPSPTGMTPENFRNGSGAAPS